MLPYMVRARSHFTACFIPLNSPQSVSAPLARAFARLTGFLDVGLQKATNPERAYTSDLKSYVTFCAQHNSQAVPAQRLTQAGGCGSAPSITLGPIEVLLTAFRP